MDYEEYFKCPKCGNMCFHINAKTLSEGDKPTEIECSACGWTGNA